MASAAKHYACLAQHTKSRVLVFFDTQVGWLGASCLGSTPGSLYFLFPAVPALHSTPNSGYLCLSTLKWPGLAWCLMSGVDSRQPPFLVSICFASRYTCLLCVLHCSKIFITLGILVSSKMRTNGGVLLYTFIHYPLSCRSISITGHSRQPTVGG